MWYHAQLSLLPRNSLFILSICNHPYNPLFPISDLWENSLPESPGQDTYYTSRNLWWYIPGQCKFGSWVVGALSRESRAQGGVKTYTIAIVCFATGTGTRFMSNHPLWFILLHFSCSICPSCSLGPNLSAVITAACTSTRSLVTFTSNSTRASQSTFYWARTAPATLAVAKLLITKLFL